eukprot:7084344-Prymnesium_polylepis.1
MTARDPPRDGRSALASMLLHPKLNLATIRLPNANATPQPTPPASPRARDTAPPAPWSAAARVMVGGARENAA